jgi:hypothetical protein
MKQLPPAFWSISATEMLQHLETVKEGLTGAEARQRLARYGSNLLKPQKRSDVFTLLLAQFKSPLILILFFATGLSFFLHNPVDAFIILTIVLVSGLLGYWEERSAANAVEKLLAIVQINAAVLRDGGPKEILLEEIVPGVTVAEAMPEGAVKIFIAIADVDALVKKPSALDDHARHNTTSVYTAAEIFPMLPEKLSTDLTSLNYESDRLAIVIEMVIAEDGSLQSSDVYGAMVRNRAKLAYNSVAGWLEGNGPMPTIPEALKNGGITFSIPPPIGPSISICHCQFRLTVICLGFASSALGTYTSRIPSR